MTIYPDELWQAVADLSGFLLSEENLETTLKRVGDLAVRTIPGCDAVGVTLFEDGKATTRAATGGLVYEVDHYQYEIGQGPCLDAVKHRQIVEIEDMAASEKWVEFSRHAAERGFRSSMSLPLVVRGSALGALNLYSRATRAIGPEDRETALLFAAQAAVALANSQTYAASIRLADQLREALSSRAVIDQAKGILMGRDACDEREAFENLRRMSQDSNTKVRVVAQEMVDQAAVDGRAPRPGRRTG